MSQSYTATAKQNPGRHAWLVEFRNPFKSDTNGKPGKKTRKGLGTNDPERAKQLVDQLNQLLSNEALWSLGARTEAAKLYEPEVVEIFYSEMEPRTSDARPLRDKLLPLPRREDGYAKVVLIGVPGAGKTTLVRQFIGTHPKREAFPSTSPNRTTTFPTEIVLQPGQFEAAVTFMTEGEARFEVEECVSAAIIEAVDGDVSRVAQTFLQKSDMRFRLKYIFGDLEDETIDFDPYADDSDIEIPLDDDGILAMTTVDRQRNAMVVRSYIDRMFDIARACKTVVEVERGLLAEMNPATLAVALELIEQKADESQEFMNLVSEILEELRTKFELFSEVGRFEKTATGWPKSWVLKVRPEERTKFLGMLRYFSGNNETAWGRLLTPLVNGMRVQGPFKAGWTSKEPKFVLLDTEGLGHKANATADLPEQAVALLHEADVILLVDSAKNGMTNLAAGKALEGIANMGHTRKLAVVFTHMDAVSEAGLRGQRLLDHVFSGLRNVVDNQLATAIAPESARFLIERLHSNTFYVGQIDKAEPKGAAAELDKLLAHLMAEQPAVVQPVAVPQYNPAFLLMAIQEAANDFRKQWKGILGIAKWQTIKALSRRYAENWGETFELRPTANLRAALESAVSRFLESPISWDGEPTADEKRDIIERLKSTITKEMPELTRQRLREQPKQAWIKAWVPRGVGSTTVRRIEIEGIFERWVPVPDARGDVTVLEFMSEVEKLVHVAIEDIKAQVAVPTEHPI